MLKPTIITIASTLCFVTTVSPARDAAACGGCFSPPETVTAVESHRMVISLSAQRTILFDQIRYTGDPADFVWVLPVPDSAATLEIADDEFFNQLERQTVPTISAPNVNNGPLNCPAPPDGWGAGAQDAGASADAGVDVYREEVVGPYQTVVIGSESATALVDWLTENGYQVPASTTPIIQHYVDLSSKFIVLRLAPDQGVSAMQPVRVEFPGFMSTFPLKMVTVGASGTLTMTLWVVAEQRYEPKNYASVEIAEGDLTWDYGFSNFSGSSNYRTVMADRINGAGGKAWVTQYARALSSLFIDSPDLAIATDTIPSPFVTRLHTEMLTDHLDTDMTLGPAAGGTVDNLLFVTNTVNPPPPPSCPDYGDNGDGLPGFSFACSSGGAGSSGGLIAVLFLGLVWRRQRSAGRARNR